jgi:hypothetical protein
MDLFDNPVGYRTSLGKMLRILLFLTEVVQKLKFLNNSNVFKAIFTRDSPKSRSALASLISAYIRQPVEVLTVISNEPAAEGLRDRHIRYDIRVRFNGGRLANVEVALHPAQ